MITIERSPKYTFGKNLSSWKRATYAAESYYQPRYDLLQDLYTDILIDCHLSAVVQNRKANVLQSEFSLKQGNKLIDPPAWLYKVIEWLAETELYGYTVLEYWQGDFYLIPRRHVIPVTNEILLDLKNEKRIKFNQQPTLLNFGNVNDLGLLHKACPIVFYKRFATAAWSEYIELFGMPVRVLKTDKKDEQARQQLYRDLENMGKAAFAVIDTEDELDFVNSSSTDAYQVYDKMVERCNSELSKLIIGQTGTTDEKSYVGAAQVHLTQAEAIAWQDKEKIKNWVNKTIFPYLKLNYVFDWVQQDTLPLTEQWKIHKEMLELGLPVDTEYLSQKYNTPFTKPQPKTEPEPNSPKPKSTQKKTTSTNKKHNPLDLGYPPAKLSFWQKTFKSIRKLLFKNDLDDVEKLLKLPKDDAFFKLFEHYKNTFLRAIDKGFKDPNWGNLEGYRFLQLQENAYKFSYAKANYVLEVINNAADDRKASVYKNLHENYTPTEANHFTASARMAKKWIQIQNTQEDFPYLQYITAHDNHVRTAHKALDGIIKPVNDPFWHTHYPPNGYNCRCTVKKLAELPENYTDKPIEPQTESSVFENNPGLTGTAFNENHRYFQEQKTPFNDLLIIEDAESIAAKKYLTTKTGREAKNFTIDFNLLPYKFYTFKNGIKSFIRKGKKHHVKNLCLPYIDSILKAKNIIEVWEAAPQKHRIYFVERMYYIKTSLFPTGYFVIELRNIQNSPLSGEQTLHFYSFATFEEIQEYQPVKIYEKAKE